MAYTSILCWREWRLLQNGIQLYLAGTAPTAMRLHRTRAAPRSEYFNGKRSGGLSIRLAGCSQRLCAADVCVCVRFLPLCQMNLWWFFNSVSIRTFTHSARANCNSSSIPLPTLFPNLILNWTCNESRWVIVPVHLWPFLIFFLF